MKHRNTQWIKGFDLLNLRLEDISLEIKVLEKYYDVEIPQPLINYFTKYKPIDIYDYSNYDDQVYFYEPGFLVVHTMGKPWGNYYPVQFICDISNVLQGLLTEDNSNLGCLHKNLKIVPIASNGSPDGSIVYSLDKLTLGKIYTLVDYQTSEISDDNLIANNIDQFIFNLEVLPEKRLNQSGVK